MAYIFASSLALGFSGAMMPGSLLTYTIRQSLANGPRAGFVIVFGHSVLELALLFLIFLGFDMVLQSDAAQIGIGLVGGLLLIYMGWDMMRSAAKNRLAVQLDEGGSGNQAQNRQTKNLECGVHGAEGTHQDKNINGMGRQPDHHKSDDGKRHKQRVGQGTRINGRKSCSTEVGHLCSRCFGKNGDHEWDKCTRDH